MSGVSTAGAAAAAGTAGPAGTLVAVRGSGPAGSPLQLHVHTQLHEHAWSKLNELVTPFDPVHVHVQIQWPATGETETVGGAAAPVAPAAVWVAIHDQSQVSDPVGASAGFGIVPIVQTHVQIQGSVPVGTTTSDPGSTTETSTLPAPVTLAVAEAPVAWAAFACVATASAPGLPTRTEMLTFVALLCAAAAV